MAQRSVLVVDEEAMVREFVAEALGGAGHEVRCAESGERAIEMLKRRPSGVVFLDLGPGTEGLSLCKEIRRDYPLALLHAMSRVPSASELAAARTAGFDDYLVKPLEAEEVLKATADAFEKIDRWNTACEQG
ncbi:MAG: response regulator [Planctomycetota bacterium]